VEYKLAQRSLPLTAGLVGVAAGVLFAGLGTCVLAWWRTYRRLLALAVVGGIAGPGVPAGAGAFLLFEVFFAPVNPYMSPTGTKYHDCDGAELTLTAYYRVHRQNRFQAIPVGIGTGVVLVVVATTLLMWHRGRQHTRARQAVVAGTEAVPLLQEAVTAHPPAPACPAVLRKPPPAIRRPPPVPAGLSDRS
jgi:Mg/Co/Ni transporter MgtE